MTTTYGTLLATPLPFGGRCRLRRAATASDPADGLVYRRQTRTSHSRQSSRRETRFWIYDFEDVTPAEFASILSAYDAGAGGTLPLSWTPPAPDDAGGAVPVFVTGLDDVRPGPGNTRQFSLQLEEVT